MSELGPKCGCDEYPECTHALYWYEGFKAGRADLDAAVELRTKEIAESFERLYWKIKTNQEAADCVRTLLTTSGTWGLAKHDAELKQDLKDQCGWMDQAEIEKFVADKVKQARLPLTEQLKEDCLAMAKAEERIWILEAEVLDAYEKSAVEVYEAYSRSNNGEVKLAASAAANNIRVLAANRAAASQTPPICQKHNETMILHFYDRPGSPPGNGWACKSCIAERQAPPAASGEGKA